MARVKVNMNEQLEQNAVARYLKEVRSEMSKVIWPTREQTVNLTSIVLAVMVIMSIFLGVLDYIFGGLIQLLISVVG